MRHTLTYATYVALVIGSAPAWAEAMQDSTSVYRSAYYLGRGDTGIATADNQEAVFYNPAGIAYGTGIYKKAILASPEVEVSQSARDLAHQLSSNASPSVSTVEDNIGKPDHVGASNFTGLILRRAALGVIASSHADVLAFNDPNSGGLEAVHASADATLGVTFSLADQVFNEHWMVGMTGKYLERGRGDVTASAANAAQIQSEIADRSNFIGSGTGGGADFGLMYRGGGQLNPSFGLAVDDLGDTKITPSTATTENLSLRQTVNLGAAIESGTGVSHFKLLMDYHDALGAMTKDPYLRLHLGAELEVWELVGLTTGLSQGYPTGGLYVDLRVARLDGGFYTQEVGDKAGERPDTRYFVRLMVGF